MPIPRFLCGLGLSVLLLAAGVHCTLFGDSGTSRQDFAHAHFAPTCGPTDGPALVIYLTKRPVGCDIVQPADIRAQTPESYVRVVLYEVWQPEVPSSLDLQSSEGGVAYSDGGWAERCVEGTCTTATEGTGDFSHGGRGDTLVHVTLEFEDGSRLSDQHLAVACGRVYSFCG